MVKSAYLQPENVDDSDTDTPKADTEECLARVGKAAASKARRWEQDLRYALDRLYILRFQCERNLEE